METTILQIIGWFFIIMGGVLLTRPVYVEKTVKGLIANEPLMFFISIFNVILGFTVLAVYSSWEWNKYVIVTIIGRASLCKGIVPLYFPMRPKKKWELLTAHKNFMYVWGSVITVFGAIVLWLSCMK